jgi:hypothetical protein
MARRHPRLGSDCLPGSNGEGRGSGMRPVLRLCLSGIHETNKDVSSFRVLMGGDNAVYRSGCKMEKTIMLKHIRFLVTWGILLFVGIIGFNFLHECGHGFGAQLDGQHVSTGFNKIGDVGKRPSDPGFRSDQVVGDILSSSSILGPLVNWLLAILFAAMLLHRSKANFSTLLLGVMAVSNAINRLPSMIAFFVSAPFGKIILADEINWVMKAVRGISFPMKYYDFNALSTSQTRIILSEPRVYFWPSVSLLISLVCFYLAYRHLYKVFSAHLSPRITRWLYGFMPLIALVLIALPLKWLDNLIRINW